MADYALVIANYLTKTSEKIPIESLAAETHLPVATVRKLLKQLLDANIVISVRGSKGGYLLARGGDEINVAEIIEAIEGPIAVTECSRAENNCGIQNNCDLRENWSYINNIVMKLLRNISLNDMANQLGKNQQIVSAVIPKITPPNLSP